MQYFSLEQRAVALESQGRESLPLNVRNWKCCRSVGNVDDRGEERGTAVEGEFVRPCQGRNG